MTKRLCKSQEAVERVWPASRIDEVIDIMAVRTELPSAASLQSLLRQLLAIVSSQKTVSNGKRKVDDESVVTKKQKKE